MPKHKATTMKHVDMIRGYANNRMFELLCRLRGYIANLGDNQEQVDMLSGASGDAILARMTDATMLELGVVTEESAASNNNPSRRRSSGKMPRELESEA